MQNEKVLVFVTPQLRCSRLIKSGYNIAKQMKAELEIICIFPQVESRNPDTKTLEALYEYSREADAQMTVYFSDETHLFAAGHTAKQNTKAIVVGFPDDLESPFISSLHALFPEIPMNMVNADGTVYKFTPLPTKSELDAIMINN